MPLDLADRYRPKRLSEIYGQPDAVEQVRAHLDSGSRAPLMLVGATGSGKSTMARIIAKTKLCVGEKAPCENCVECRAFDAGGSAFGYTVLDAGRFKDVDTVAGFAELMGGSSLVNTWVCFIDEIQQLGRAACDTLLLSLEANRTRSMFVCATTDPELVPRTLRSRCRIVRFDPLSRSQLYLLLTNICRQEGLLFDSRALDMISYAAQGSAREALHALDSVTDLGDINTENARKVVARGSDDLVIDYLQAVVDGDLDMQDDAINRWNAEPVEIAKLIRDTLLHLYNMHGVHRRIDNIVNAALFLLTDEQREPIVDGFRQRAREADLALGAYLFELLDMWTIDPSMLTDRSSLMVKIRKFDYIVNQVRPGRGEAIHRDRGDSGPPDVTSVSHGPGTTSNPRGEKRTNGDARPYRQRSTREKRAYDALGASSENMEYLSLQQAEQIYDMASMLPQHYGVLLNAKFVFHHAKLGITEAQAGQKLVSDFTHALSQQTRAWAPAHRAHWIYLHRQTATGLSTLIAAHIPPDGLSRTERWAIKWIDDRFPTLARDSLTIDLQRPERATGYVANRFQRHWWLVRNLWGSIAPDILHSDSSGRRRPLLDLLRADRSMRAPLGQLGGLRAFGASRSLGPEIRRKQKDVRMSFLSAFRDAAWDAVFTGWELKEHEDRLAEARKRTDQQARIRFEYPDSANILEASAQTSALERLSDSFPIDPRLRLRSWRGWWQQGQNE